MQYASIVFGKKGAEMASGTVPPPPSQTRGEAAIALGRLEALARTLSPAGGVVLEVSFLHPASIMVHESARVQGRFMKRALPHAKTLGSAPFSEPRNRFP